MDVARKFPESVPFLLRMIVPEEEGGRGMEVPELTSTTQIARRPRVSGTSHPCVPPSSAQTSQEGGERPAYTQSWTSPESF
jgi:hypothetical protein